MIKTIKRNQTNEPITVTISDAIQLYGIGRFKIWEAMNEGKLKYSQPYLRRGKCGPNSRKRILETSAIRRWIDEGMVETTDIRNA